MAAAGGLPTSRVDTNGTMLADTMTPLAQVAKSVVQGVANASPLRGLGETIDLPENMAAAALDQPAQPGVTSTLLNTFERLGKHALERYLSKVPEPTSPVTETAAKVGGIAGQIAPFIVAPGEMAMPLMGMLGLGSGAEKADQAHATSRQRLGASAAQGAVDAALGHFLPLRLKAVLGGEIAAGTPLGEAAASTLSRIISGSKAALQTGAVGAGATLGQSELDDMVHRIAYSAKPQEQRQMIEDALWFGIAGMLGHPVAAVKEAVYRRAEALPEHITTAAENDLRAATSTEAQNGPIPQDEAAGRGQGADRQDDHHQEANAQTQGVLTEPSAGPIVEVGPASPESGGVPSIRTEGIAEAVGAGTMPTPEGANAQARGGRGRAETGVPRRAAGEVSQPVVSVLDRAIAAGRRLPREAALETGTGDRVPLPPEVVFRGQGDAPDAPHLGGRAGSHLAGTHFTEDEAYAATHAAAYGERGQVARMAADLKRPFSTERTYTHAELAAINPLVANAAANETTENAERISGGTFNRLLRESVRESQPAELQNTMSGRAAEIAAAGKALKAAGYDGYHHEVRTEDGRTVNAWSAFDRTALSPAKPAAKGPHVAGGPVQLPPLAPEPIARGNTGEVYYPGSEETVPYRWVVRDLGDYVVSHDKAGNVNPNLPEALQPRDRTRLASQAQVQRIADKFEPGKLFESEAVNQGAPTVEQGSAAVIAGHGRLAAAELALERPATREAYTARLLQRAESLGLDPEPIRAAAEAGGRPFLAREVDPAKVDLADLAKRSNDPVTATMSAPEQALRDAAALTPDVLALYKANEAGDINTAANRQFVGEVLARLPQNDLGGLVDAHGGLSQAGVRRVENALLAAAYGDAEALAKITESTDSNIRNVGRAMLDAAPEIAAQRSAMEAGHLYNLDISSDVAAAARKLSSLRSAGKVSVADFLAQSDLPGVDTEKLSPEARLLLKAFDENTRSSTRIGDILRAYAKGVDAEGAPQQPGLFPAAAPERLPILERAVREATNERQKALFDEATKGKPGAEVAPQPTGVSEPEAEPRIASQYRVVTLKPKKSVVNGKKVVERSFRLEVRERGGEWQDTGRVFDRQDKAAAAGIDMKGKPIPPPPAKTAVEPPPAATPEPNRAGESLPEMPGPKRPRPEEGGFLSLGGGKRGSRAGAGSAEFSTGMRSWIKKWFGSGGVLPKAALDAIERATGLKNVQRDRIIRRAEALRDAIGKDAVLRTRTRNYLLADTPTQRAQLGKLLPDNVRQIANEMIDHLSALQQSVIDEPGLLSADMAETFKARLGKHLVRAYAAHYDPAHLSKLLKNTELMDSLRTEFRAMPEFAEHTDAQIDGLIKQFASDQATFDPFATGGVGGTLDTGMFRHRDEIPEPIRRAMGEYEDPAFQYYLTANRLSRNLTTFRMYREIANLGKAGGWLKEVPEGELFTEIPGTGTRRPLAGLNTTKDIAETIVGAEKEIHDGFWRTLTRWTGLSKQAKTVFDPQTQSRNFIANILFSMASGNGVGSQLPIIERARLQRMPWDKHRRPISSERATALNVQGSQESLGTIKEMTGEREWGVARSALGKLVDKATDLYKAGDDYPKRKALERETAKQIYISGDESPAGRRAAEERAAEIVKNVLPNFNRLSRLLKKVRANPITGTFLGFPAETVRTLKNISLQGLRELKSDNPREKLVGAHRLASLSYVLAFPTLMGAGLKALYESRRKKNGRAPDYETAIRAARSLAPPYMRNSQLVVLRAPGDGTVTVVDVSFMDPFGQFRRIYNAAMAETAGGKKGGADRAIDAITEAADPYVGEGIGTSELIDVARNTKKLTGERIYTPGASHLSQAYDIAKHIASSIEPGIVAKGVRVYKAATGTQDSGYRKYELGPEMLALLGPRVMTLDSRQTLHFAPQKFARLTQDAAALKNKSENETLGALERKRFANDSAATLKLGAGQLYDVVQGAKLAGLEEDEIRSILKKERIAGPYIDAAFKSPDAIIEAWGGKHDKEK